MPFLSVQESRRKRIKNLISQIENTDPINSPETYQFLCRYLCIRLVAYLDLSVRDIMQEYCKFRNASDEIARAVDSYLQGKVSNLHCGKIESVLSSMNREWGEAFRQGVKEEGVEFSKSRIPSQISSLKGQRDNFAHGDESGVSFRTLTQYFNVVEDVIKLIKSIIFPSHP